MNTATVGQKASLILATLIVALTGKNALAASFSNPTFDPGKIDAGIPGFIGPDGLGNVTPNNVVNPLFVGWATGLENYSPTSGVAQQWLAPEQTLGPVTGNVFDITSLGELDEDQIAAGVAPGQITLTFDTPIRNGSGADFAVFENGFEVNGKLFGELAYVEVSTDGINFVRFPSISLTPEPVGEFEVIDATTVFNLAGKHVNNAFEFDGEFLGSSWGTPFDLDQLLDAPLINSGLLDLNQVNYVRIVDIPGNGEFLDSQNNPIFDPYATPIPGSGGFDLEAVGVINSVSVPEPASTLGLFLLGVGGLWTLKACPRRK